MLRERPLPHTMFKEKGGKEDEPKKGVKEEWWLKLSGSPKVKGEVLSPYLNVNSNSISSMHRSDSNAYLPMHNLGFKYHDRTKVSFYDHSVKM